MALSNPRANSIEQMRMLRLLQWQLQHFLSSASREQGASKTSFDSAFDVRIEQLSGFSKAIRSQPIIVVLEGNKTDGLEENAYLRSIWMIEIADDLSDSTQMELYAQAGIANYWQLDLNNIELHIYQQPEASGYSSHRVLQVGDHAFPQGVPLAVQLQEPVPLHFMTRTLNGQQTYQTHALPFSFSQNSM